jgi:hypothetical protein
MDKLDLDIIFSVKIDSVDRLNNLDNVIGFLQRHVNCDITIVEQDTNPVLKYRYNCKYIFHEVDEFFNKFKGLNIGVKNSPSKVIAHYDADVVMNPKQLLGAYKLINSGRYEVVYPYDGRFYDVPKKYHNNIDTLNDIDVKEFTLFNNNCVGGVVMFDKQTFIECGGGNEKFIGLGYDDNEIYVRFEKLGKNPVKVEGPLFHLNHTRGETAYNNNPHLNVNVNEFQRINNMTPKELKNEIKNWKYI